MDDIIMDSADQRMIIFGGITAANLVGAQVITLSQFAMLSPPGEHIYPPLVARACTA